MQSVADWLITTGDPEVADKVSELFGGDAPEKYETKGEDNLRVFSATKEVEVIVGGPKDFRQKMVFFNRAGKLVQAGDGQTLDYPEDQKGQDGFGPSPQTELYFRLAADPELGIWKFQSGAWGLAYDVAAEDLEGQLAKIGGPVRVTLKLEPVTFAARSGEMAGKTVTYAKSSITIRGRQ